MFDAIDEEAFVSKVAPDRGGSVRRPGNGPCNAPPIGEKPDFHFVATFERCPYIENRNKLIKSARNSWILVSESVALPGVSIPLARTEQAAKRYSRSAPTLH